MKIEARNIKVAHSLSQETNAFTATIYVDGVRAFEASNHGTGGPDNYHRVPGYDGPTEREVSGYLASAMEPLKTHGMTLVYDLELYVGQLVDAFIKEQEVKRIRRRFDGLLTKEVGAITPDGRFVTFGKRYPPLPDHLAKIRESKPDYTVVNGADAATLDRALALYCPDLAAA